MTSRSARTSFRRTRRTAAAVGAASLLTFLATDPGSATPAAPAAAAFNNGTGTAIALAYKVNPVFGGLSFGITAGESVAGHQNTAATGQSKAINLGVIGVTLAGEGCDGADPTLAEEDQPQAVVVSSNDENAEQGRSEQELNVITKFARATTRPFAEAITTVAPLGDAGVALISGGRSTATSGIVSDGQREARAISEIGELSLVDGLIKIGDMRWEAVQRTGAKTEQSGSFEVGSLTIAGQKILLPSDGLEQVKLLKDTLAAVGLQITVPEFRFEQNIAFVSPMKIGIIPSDLRDGLLSTVLGATQPVRESFVDLIEQYDCGSPDDIFGNNGKTLITILDLALGSVSGAGSLNLELGGVQATTAEIQGFTGLGVLPPLPNLADPNVPLSPTAPSAPGVDTGVDVVTPPASDNTGSPTPTPTEPIVDLEGDRGGALLGVGAGGLLLLLATAEGDRRKMRRAQREIPLEV